MIEPGGAGAAGGSGTAEFWGAVPGAAGRGVGAGGCGAVAVLLAGRVGVDSVGRGGGGGPVALGDLSMSDPFILPDEASKTYYLTGAGGGCIRARI